MSCWTNVNIRFTVDRLMSVTDIENLVGHIVSWEDMLHYSGENDRFQSYEKLPLGSEGSLDITVLKTCSYKTVFVIHGSLRDYFTTKHIEGWFNNLIESDKQNELNRTRILKAFGYANAGESIQFKYKHKFTLKERMHLWEWTIKRIWSSIIYVHK